MSRDILISLIDADPEQPRRHFDPAMLQELAASIEASGLAVPILVRPVGDRYMLVHGERRTRACKSLGWTTITAEVRELDEESARWLTLIENIQRADLSPLEEAHAYEGALATGLTQQQLGARIGKTQSYIAQKLRLLKMAPEVQEAINSGMISEGIARQLLRLDVTRHNWQVLIGKCVTDGWSVRRVKNFVDYQLLVWYPQWYDVEEMFSDLVEFEARLDKECQAGYASTEDHLRTQRALGYHLTLAEKVHNAGADSLAQHLLKECPLSLLNEYGKFIAQCEASGIGVLDALKMKIFFDTVDDAKQKINADDIDADDATLFWREVARRSCAWFDANWQDQVSVIGGDRE